MKQLALSLVMSFCALCAIAQVNLVPNESFELYSDCPSGPNDIWMATPWFSLYGTVDYFNSCSSSLLFGVPSNAGGYQSAATGEAYSGLRLWTTTGQSDREFISVQLTEALQMGKTYHIEFHLSLLDTVYYAVKNVGMLFTDTIPYTSGPITTLLDYNPQIQYDGPDYLDDKDGWQQVSDSFVALGGELFITIGNFDSDQSTDTLFVGGGVEGFNAAQYYLDDVSVVEETITPISSLEQIKPSLEIYPNPAREQMAVDISSSSHNGTLALHDASGRVVLSQQITSDRLYLDVSMLDSGIYTVSLQSEEGVLRKKVVIQR